MSNKQFQAVMQQNGAMDAGYIEIPFDVEQEYGAKRVKVKALLNGVEYRGSLVRMKTPCHILGIPKAIRSQMGAVFGDTIDVSLEKDDEIRLVQLPEDLAAMLNPNELANFNNLSYTRQKAYVTSIISAKKIDTRASRIASMIADLSH